MPADLRDVTIVTLYKNKGRKTDCRNHRCVSLLSIAGQILVRISLNMPITSVSESNLPEVQCDFRPGRSTIDMMLAVCQVKEECIEQQVDMYSQFTDSTKAFDTVNTEALWATLAKMGCPYKVTTLVRPFRDNMTGQVLCNGNCANSSTALVVWNKAAYSPLFCSIYSSRKS